MIFSFGLCYDPYEAYIKFLAPLSFLVVVLIIWTIFSFGLCYDPYEAHISCLGRLSRGHYRDLSEDCPGYPAPNLQPTPWPEKKKKESRTRAR